MRAAWCCGQWGMRRAWQSHEMGRSVECDAAESQGVRLWAERASNPSALAADEPLAQVCCTAGDGCGW
jgi:hypothetical protein